MPGLGVKFVKNGRASGYNNKAWKKLLANNSSDEINELRDKIKLVVDDIGLSIP